MMVTLTSRRASGPGRMRVLVPVLLAALCCLPGISGAVEICSGEGLQKLKSAGVTTEQIATICPSPEVAPAAPATPPPSNVTAVSSPAGPRPRIGLALGGGGARGIAHIGVIRALEQLHIPIDYIAGTSMGSIIGGLYACGYTPDEMEKLVGSIDWTGIFDDAPKRADQPFRVKEDDYLHLAPLEMGLKPGEGGLVLPPALIAGNKLGFVLRTATQACASVTDFDDLRIPFRAVATDIQTGEPYVMGSGSLATSIRASMAIPAAFTPVEIDGHLLIDGGEAQNLPVQTVRSTGADIVIAVNVGSSGAATFEKPDNVAQMLERLISLPLQQNTLASAKLATMVITPNLDGYGSGDFAKGLEMVPLGYQATLQDKATLQQWSAPEVTYAAWKERHDVTLPLPPPVIDRIEIAPMAGVDPRRIEGLVHTRAGQPLDNRTLEEDLTRIYGLGLFESVRYTLVTDDGETTLLISAVPKPWGPTYLSVGLNMATDFATTTQFGITALVDATELNRLGGEWKTTLTVGLPFDFETRFYQPLSYGGGLFLSPYAGWQLFNVEFWNTAGTRTVETTQFSRPFGGLDIGYDFGNFAELRVGYLRASQDDTVLVGGTVTHETDQGALTAQLRIDRLDDISLPQSGYFLGVDYAANRTEYGGSFDYDIFSAQADVAGTFGRWTGNLRLEYGTSFDTTLPSVDRFALGGLFRLSGRPIRNLRGEDLVLAVGQLYYRLGGTGAGFIKNFSVGGSLETGNAWSLREDVSFSDLESAGSIFLITETIVGPFSLGYGRSGDFDSFYLYLNRTF